LHIEAFNLTSFGDGQARMSHVPGHLEATTCHLQRAIGQKSMRKVLAMQRPGVNEASRGSCSEIVSAQRVPAV